MENLHTVAVPRRELFEVWRKEKNIEKRFDCVYNYIVNSYGLENCASSVLIQLQSKIRHFCIHVKDRWIKSKYYLQIFLKRNNEWLNGTIECPTSAGSSSSSVCISRPRKQKEFEAASEKTKRRRVRKIIQETSTEELTFATQMSLRSKGKRDAAKILSEVVKSPKRATKVKRAYFLKSPKPTQMSPDEALAGFIDKKSTKSQYLYTRKEVLRQGADIYPGYDKLLEAKKRCYPENVNVSESVAEIDLQSLISHTIKRLALTVEFPEHCISCNIIFKWGCDGASGYTKYKQIYTEEESEQYDDSYLFVISLVPMKIVSNTGDTIWNNPRPSSTRFCRPIKLLFQKETALLVRHEVNHIEDQIKKLKPVEIQINQRKVMVTSTLLLTMIDGKICFTLAGSSAQNCYLCGATPKTMNQVIQSATVDEAVLDKALSFGIAPLHCYIKTLECILHIAYRLDVKVWQVKKENKEAVANRKKYVQDRLRAELGLLVDIPKPGFGTTNDGNTARRFFANPKESAMITGVSEELITRLSVVLKTVSCSLAINPTAFHKYCIETAQLYVNLYNWYYMPATLHKLLIHGSEIITHCMLPLGSLSEEAQEARNKDCKRFREYHSRKFSRKETMEDIVHMLLITSDPLISCLRKLPTNKNKQLPQEVSELLLSETDISESVDESDDSEILFSDSDSD